MDKREKTAGIVRWTVFAAVMLLATDKEHVLCHRCGSAPGDLYACFADDDSGRKYADGRPAR